MLPIYPNVPAGPSIDTNLLLGGRANQVSTDAKYLRHEFLTYLGGWSWANGWTPQEVREALTTHLRGWFWQSAQLARDVVRYPPIMGSLRQRIAPCLRTKWRVSGPDRAPGRFAVEELTEVWTALRGFYQELLRDLALMGFAWIHIHWEPDAQMGIEIPRLKRWPLEATWWRPPSPAFPGGFYASTVDSGYVRMIHGDGHWVLIGNGERPHELGAILALGLSYVGGEIQRRDRANLSEAAGRAVPVATLPEQVGVKDEAGQAVQDAIIQLGRPRRGIVVPHGTTVEPFQIASDTSFFTEALKDELQLVAFALLGQSGTMAQGSGGVYTAPVFEGVLESLIDGDHEATVRGWLEGISRPYVAVNDYAIDPPGLIGERPQDVVAKAKSAGERATLLGTTVKAWRDAGLDPTQDDVDQLAASLGTQTVKIGAMPAPAPVKAPPSNDTKQEAAA